MSKLVRIRDVRVLEGHRVSLDLTDGTTVERDLAPHLTGPAFERIRSDRAAFAAVRVDRGALAWPDGADLCPDVVIWSGPPPAAVGTHAA